MLVLSQTTVFIILDLMNLVHHGKGYVSTKLLVHLASVTVIHNCMGVLYFGTHRCSL